jgi:hypothetical protein
MKNNTKLIWLAGATLGLALSLGGCEKKSEEPPASVGSAPAPAPAPEKSTPDQPGSSQGSSDTGATGSTQKPEDASKAQKEG